MSNLIKDASKQRVFESTQLCSKEDEIKDYYRKWASNYDEDLLENCGYRGPEITINHFKNLSLDKNCWIIDLLGGTGVIGKMLKEEGYKNIDILDASEEMLEKSKKYNAYQNYISAYLDADHGIPCPDDTYDCAIICGGFVPGHASSDIFPEVTRIIKPGGVYMFALRERYLKEDKVLSKLDADVEKQISNGKWKQLSKVKVENFIYDLDGLVYCMQIL